MFDPVRVFNLISRTRSQIQLFKTRTDFLEACFPKPRNRPIFDFLVLPRPWVEPNHKLIRHVNVKRTSNRIMDWKWIIFQMVSNQRRNFNKLNLRESKCNPKILAKTSNFCSIFGQSLFGGYFKGWNFWAFLSQVKPIYKIGMIKNYSSGANENVLNQILSSIACLI